jgi:hypothetical protein
MKRKDGVWPVSIAEAKRVPISSYLSIESNPRKIFLYGFEEEERRHRWTGPNVQIEIATDASKSRNVILMISSYSTY